MSTLDMAPRLVGEFVVPHDLPIGGTVVGELSGIGRDRRSGWSTVTGDVPSRRVLPARFTEVQYFQLPTVQVRPVRTEWGRERIDRPGSGDIRVDHRTGNLVWSQRAARGEPAVPAPDERPEARGPAGREQDETPEPVTTARFRLSENEDAADDGTGCLDSTEVAAMRSVLGVPVNTVRRTLLADLADAGVPDPDNFEGMTQGPDLPSGGRTLLLASDNGVRKELRAGAIRPKPL